MSRHRSCTALFPNTTLSRPHTVTGTDGGKTATASLSVNPGLLDHIEIRPTSLTISAVGSSCYTAHGFDAFNNSLGNVTGATTFTISPNGSCTGATCTATVAG